MDELQWKAAVEGCSGSSGGMFIPSCYCALELPGAKQWDGTLPFGGRIKKKKKINPKKYSLLPHS